MFGTVPFVLSSESSQYFNTYNTWIVNAVDLYITTIVEVEEPWLSLQLNTLISLHAT